MAIYLGSDRPDDIYLGASKVDAIYLGADKVWPIDVEPGQVIDFTASDDEDFQVTCTWTATSIGDPTPIYYLYEAGKQVAENITSPYIREVGSGTREYYVMAVNSEGATPSNTDNGTSIGLVAPGRVTNFSASTNQYGKVTCIWTNTPIGDPVPTYDLYEDSIKVATNISSGYIRNVAGGTRDYYIKAINSQGYTLSNEAEGTSRGVLTYSIPGTYSFQVPIGITSLELCMIGGGGGGSSLFVFSEDYAAGGGHAGTIVSSVKAVSQGATLTIVVGVGGTSPSVGDGANGTDSKVGGTIASGGIGGKKGAFAVDAPYNGMGDTKPTNCYGTFKDGIYAKVQGRHLFGGEAGFGDGGRYTRNGGMGAGGGGGDNNATGGNGGNGYIRIKY